MNWLWLCKLGFLVLLWVRWCAYGNCLTSFRNSPAILTGGRLNGGMLSNGVTGKAKFAMPFPCLLYIYIYICILRHAELSTVYTMESCGKLKNDRKKSLLWQHHSERREHMTHCSFLSSVSQIHKRLAFLFSSMGEMRQLSIYALETAWCFYRKKYLPSVPLHDFFFFQACTRKSDRNE